MSARWRIWYSDRALCRGADTNLFFNLANPRDTAYARSICGLCVIRQECLERALEEEHGTPGFGIRGGLTPKERKKLMKERTRQAKIRAA